jgi:hypothetical protein
MHNTQLIPLIIFAVILFLSVVLFIITVLHVFYVPPAITFCIALAGLVGTTGSAIAYGRAVNVDPKGE